MKSPTSKSATSKHLSTCGNSNPGADAVSTLPSLPPSVKQFIVLDSELDEKSKLASKCLAALPMERKQWSNIRELVGKALNTIRNNKLLGMRNPEEIVAIYGEKWSGFN
ncbi:hypothetical protein G9A89_000321 [Geosiphon pyriformis]|nr:hypothetical protein G9A89_000321 [Geosiphon pyriformis]